MKNIVSALEYRDIKIDQVYDFKRKFTYEDVKAFATLSGDKNPLHVDKTFGKNSQFGQNVVHGMLISSLFSTLVGMYCPGEKSLYLSQSLEFRRPLFIGQTVQVRGTVVEKNDSVKIITMVTEILRNDEKLVTGLAKVKILD